MRQIYLRSYRQEYDYYYYRRDHLGNNVAVWNATEDSTVQRTFYYASGLPMSCSTGQSAQSRKYNGKEYVEDHGFDVYDYGFRGYYATIGRFTSIDPLAEQTPWQSPYVYANNNFVNNIDYWGLAAIGSTVGFHSNIFPVTTLNWVAVDDDGNVVGWGDDEDDNHVYLVDEYWDGTYAGLADYDIIGWEIRSIGYIKGMPCYYWKSVTQANVEANGLKNINLNVSGSKVLMYGNSPASIIDLLIDSGIRIYGGIDNGYGIAGNITYNELYWVGKNGKCYTFNKLHKQGGWAYSYKVAGQSLKLQQTRNVGKYLSIGAIVVEGIDIVINRQIQASNIINICLTIGSFSGVGALIAAGYFIVDTGVALATGNSLNDYINHLTGPIVQW